MYGAGKYCTGRERSDDLPRHRRARGRAAPTQPRLRRRSSTHGRAGTPSPCRCARTTSASSNWSTKAPRTWASPTPANCGARGYDMTPADFQAETDRLWGQVKPLYEQLQCYTTNKLVEKYGATRAKCDGMIPAHLTGNLWQQDWGNLWPIAAALPGRRQPRHHRRAAAAARSEVLPRELAEHRTASGRDRRPTSASRSSRAADLAQAKADGQARRRISTSAWACRSCRRATGTRRSSSSRATATWSATPAPGP